MPVLADLGRASDSTRLACRIPGAPIPTCTCVWRGWRSGEPSSSWGCSCCTFCWLLWCGGARVASPDPWRSPGWRAPCSLWGSLLLPQLLQVSHHAIKSTTKILAEHVVSKRKHSKWHFTRRTIEQRPSNGTVSVVNYDFVCALQAQAHPLVTAALMHSQHILSKQMKL